MSSLARESFLRKEEKRRLRIAWGFAIAIYLLAGLGLLAQGLFGRESFSMNPGPIQIRIGSPDGLDETSKVLPALKLGSAAPVTPAAPALPTPALEAPKAGATVLAPKTPSQPVPAGAEAPSPEVAMPATRLARDPGAPDSGTESMASGFLSGSGSASLKGSEMGNSFETNLGGGGSIGRALSVPIYFYMPLPQVLPFAFPDRFTNDLDGFVTKESRMLFFSRYYRKAGSSWQLIKPVLALDERPGLWALLENAGYDPSQADYKKLRTLGPVTIDFELGPFNAETRRVPLLSVELKTSSGDKDVDNAVLYAFRQASYSNSGKDKVKARFTYRFD